MITLTGPELFMDQHETPLQFAVRFSQMDLSVLRDGDRLNLKEELWGRFFTRDDILYSSHVKGMFGFPTWGPAEFTNQQLVDLQKKTSLLVREWARMKSEDDASDATEGRVRSDGFVGRFPDKYRLSTAARGGGSLSVEGDFSDVFLLTLSMMLVQGGGDTLRSCGECGNTFSKRGRRKFCSPRCLDRATKRRYRKKLKEGGDGKKKK